MVLVQVCISEEQISHKQPARYRVHAPCLTHQGERGAFGSRRSARSRGVFLSAALGPAFLLASAALLVLQERVLGGEGGRAAAPSAPQGPLPALLATGRAVPRAGGRARWVKLLFPEL